MIQEAHAKDVLIDILDVGILRIRAFGFVGNAAACAVEADHLHNIPFVLRSFTWEALFSYWNVDRPGFIGGAHGSVEQFKPLWSRLEKLVDTCE